MSLRYNGTTTNAVGTIAALDTGDWTIAAMIHADSAGEGDAGIIVLCRSGASARQRLQFDSAAREVTCFQAHATVNARAETSEFMSLDEWTVLIGTYRASDATCRIYIGAPSHQMVESVYLSQTPGTGARSTGGSAVNVGNNGGGTLTFDGRIAHVVIDSREWSAAEMALYRRSALVASVESVRGFWPLMHDGFNPLVGGGLTVSNAVATIDPPLAGIPSINRRLRTYAS